LTADLDVRIADSEWGTLEFDSSNGFLTTDLVPDTLKQGFELCQH